MELLALAGSAAALSFASSLHCATMCGAFVLVARTAPEWHVGKAITYAALGAAVGGLGGVALAANPALGWATAALCAGAVVAAAAGLAGWTPVRAAGSSRLSGALRGLVASSGVGLRLRRLGFGAACGLLPCGVLYAGLALAALAGDAAGGAIVMAAFALGTVPSLVLVGGSTRPLAALRGRVRLRRAAAAFVLVLGLAAVGHRLPGVGSHDVDCVDPIVAVD